MGRFSKCDFKDIKINRKARKEDAKDAKRQALRS